MSMDFTVEFYETEAGESPLREFLDELNSSDPDDFAAVVAGLAKNCETGSTIGSRCPKLSAKGCLNCAM
jgi:hypothetical protein